MRHLTVLLSLLCTAVAVPLQGAERIAAPAEKPAGSGVIVHSDGYILTAHHVVANAKRIVVVTAGEFRAPAILVSADAEHDLALLKIETVGLTEAPIGYAGSVRLDQEIVTVGFPFGLKDVSVTRGRIAAVRTKGVQRVFQVDAAINPGNSGGALFTRRGEVIGVLTTKFTHPSGIVPEGMAFAVPISYATPLLANIPDFDFTAIGRSRKHSRASPKEALAEDLTRTTVRIETMRMADQPAALPVTPPAHQLPPTQIQPAPVGRAGPAGDPNVIKANEQLRAAQQEETGRLSQQGTAIPAGMLLVPGGEFVMGAEDLAPDTRPMHRVMLGSFWLDRYKVTNGEYRGCVDGGGCLPPKDRRTFDDAERVQHPVVNVTWTQARNYCHWKGKRLPTEAEWEKAARGTDARRYPWGNTTDPSFHRPKNGETSTLTNGTEPVGSRPANVSPYGIFDMVGSVSEWVKDWYAEDFYQVSPSHDPQGPVRGSFRVLRGGELSERPLEHHVSIRGWDEMTYWGPTLGIRCALDAP
ncbi:MAG: SUMF1/EgtB/PvdO family nonheme iron enzyme [Nitrospira sp. CR1.3]|nr:SUMF1/EgtB/PvdO family nonheme iron enzyme [Nitrospira sp. CR1.3]